MRSYGLPMQNNRIKVCILTSVHQVFDVRIFHKEAKSLAKAGYDVTLIAQHSKDEVVDDVKIIAVPESYNRFYRVLITDIRILISAFKQKADIYHFHDPELIPVGVVLKLSGKKVIYDVHEDLPEQIMSKHYILHWQRKPLAALVRLFEKTISNMFDCIITATDSIKEKFKEHISVITIGNFPIIDIDKTYEGKIDRDMNSSLLVYVGGLTKVRGISQVVYALEYLPNAVELMLLGEFSPKPYEDEIRHLKGFEKVRYLGSVDFEEVNGYLSTADIGIICFMAERNHINSRPTKLFEYMEAGLPVVASNFQLWREIVDGSSCGICVNPTNPKEISDAIKYLIEHPGKAKEMGENGRKAVLERYNWDKEAKKLLVIYEELSK